MSYSNKKWYKPAKLSTKIIFAAVLILFIRLLANIPLPFINKDYLSLLFADSSAYSLINNFSGGAFNNMTFMALGVTPYISASIILQLLCVTFPKLKDIQKQGDYGQKKWKRITVITGIALAILQSIGVAVTLGHRGLFTNYSFGPVCAVCALWVLGATITILVGEYISKYCIGNGVSLILAANIIAELPRDVLSFYQVYVSGKTALQIIASVAIFAIVVFGLVAFTVILTNAKKEIPVIYSNASGKSSTVLKNNSNIPIKLNASGVMPVIFASTIFSLPLMFMANTNSVTAVFYNILSTNRWYSFNNWLGFIGLALYFVLVVAFAYFYEAITFAPGEIATRLRKRGACIPGIRPGRPTEEYLYNKSKYMTGIGAVMLFFLTKIPTFITCVTSIYSLSFGGTSVIIVVGVIVETAIAIKSDLMVKSYVKHSNKHFFGISIKNNQSI